jgi:hypothetical protein
MALPPPGEKGLHGNQPLEEAHIPSEEYRPETGSTSLGSSATRSRPPRPPKSFGHLRSSPSYAAQNFRITDELELGNCAGVSSSIGAAIRWVQADRLF